MSFHFLATSLDEAFDLHSQSSSSKENERGETDELAKKLRKELEDLQFRNTCEWQTSNGKTMKINSNPLFNMENNYPQQKRNSTDFSFSPQMMTTYNAKHPFGTTTRFNEGDCKSIEEDFFEGMNIRVNPFEDSDDIALEEADCPPATRFQQLQWAIQRQKEHYQEQLQMPERVCCSLM